MFEMNKTKLKKSIAAALAVATLFTAPATVADAHFLSCAQEKEAGNAAVAEFNQKYRTYRDGLLDHIQTRIMENNKDRLWYLGENPNSKRGLEHILMADADTINAMSYPGGQVFVYKPMLDLLAQRTEDGSMDGPQNPWKVDQIYQMSALASTVGHEFAHWANEDWLRIMDKQLAIKYAGILIPVGNVWAAIGVSAGSSVLNILSSRQMGFRTEQQADEWGMKYLENVPEYSIGGEAINEYRFFLRKRRLGIDEGGGFDNFVHPHSKTYVRLMRALDYQKESSNGFIEWKAVENGWHLYVNGQREDYLYPRDDVSAIDRTFYVMGQIATAIKLGIAADYNLKLYRGDELFTNGSPNETFALFEGTGKDGKRRVKMLDKYTIPRDKMEAIMKHVNDTDAFKKKCRELGVSLDEMINYTYPRVMLRTLQENRIKYSQPVKVMQEYGTDDN